MSYGEVAVALVGQLALALVAAVGMPDTLARTFFKTRDGPRRAASLVALVCGTGLAIAVVADLTGDVWSPVLLGLDYDAPVRLAVWASVPLAVILTAQALLRARDLAAAFLVTAVLATAGTQTVAVLTVVAWDATATAFMTGIFAATVVTAVVSVAFAGFAVAPLRELRFVRAALRTSLPVLVSSVSLYVIWAGNRAVVTRLDGAAEAARFQVAYLVGGLTILLISAVYSAWSPIVLGAGERRWHTLAETAPVVYRVAAAASAAAALGAPIALLAVAPSSYEPRDLASTSAIVALSAVPFAAYCSRLHVVLWHGRTPALAGATVAAATVNVALNLLLIPPFGLDGAAAASVAAYALQALLVAAAARRLTRVPWSQRPLAAAFAGSALAVAVAFLMPMSTPWLVVRFVLALSLLGWLLHWALRLRASRPTGVPE